MVVDKGNPITEAEMAELRERLKALKENEGLSWSDMAKESGINVGMLQPWANGTYKGKDATAGMRVREYLDSRARGIEITSALPSSIKFKDTPTSQLIMTRLDYANKLKDFAMITGPAGIGKTAAIRQYEATNPNVFVVTIAPSQSSLAAALVAISKAVKVKHTARAASVLQRRIIDRLKEVSGFVIIDESNHLPGLVIEEVRSIHDATETGFALLGNEQLYADYAAGAKDGMHPQVTSRIGIKLNLQRPKYDDVKALAEDWKVTSKKQIDFLHKVSSKPGALRGVSKTLQLATILAADSGAGVEMEHLKTAFSQFAVDGRAI